MIYQTYLIIIIKYIIILTITVLERVRLTYLKVVLFLEEVRVIELPQFRVEGSYAVLIGQLAFDVGVRHAVQHIHGPDARQDVAQQPGHRLARLRPHRDAGGGLRAAQKGGIDGIRCARLCRLLNRFPQRGESNASGSAPGSRTHGGNILQFKTSKSGGFKEKVEVLREKCRF